MLLNSGDDVNIDIVSFKFQKTTDRDDSNEIIGF